MRFYVCCLQKAALLHAYWLLTVGARESSTDEPCTVGEVGSYPRSRHCKCSLWTEASWTQKGSDASVNAGDVFDRNDSAIDKVP